MLLRKVASDLTFRLYALAFAWPATLATVVTGVVVGIVIMIMLWPTGMALVPLIGIGVGTLIILGGTLFISGGF